MKVIRVRHFYINKLPIKGKQTYLGGNKHVAISIPIFTSQLEKAREATDAANIRAAYAEVAADALDEATLETAKTGITVDLKQQTDGWGTTPDIGGIAAADISGTPKKDGTCQVKWDDTKKVITLTYSA